MPTIPVVIGVVLSYLLGSVPFGVIVARARGVDIFKAGSGNIGATNVGRVLGRKSGVLVFVLDFLKGVVPTAIMNAAFGVTAGVLAGLAAFLGHVFPAYLRFHGGKGVATGFGVALVLLPGPTAVAALTWVTVLAVTRYVSWASVLAAAMIAAARLATAPPPAADEEGILTAFSLVAAALVAVRHRANLARLASGTENRVADSPRLIMLARVLHVLAVGLWFGAGVFFSFIAAPTLFATLDSNTFGVAVGPLFPPNFALQGVCAVIGLATALGWQKQHPSERVHRWRVVVLLLAALAVLAGWPIVGKVSELRGAPEGSEARAAFKTWHLVSLLLNMLAIGLAGVAVVLTAALPEHSRNQEPRASARG
jgi:acyl-phosphate glycerol 3-phosphate acyltransferase